MKPLLLFLSLSNLLFSSIQLPSHFRADFTQKVTNSKNKVLKYKGKVTFSDNTYFKWEYKEPSLKEVCTDGFNLRIVDHDLEQVSSYFINQGLDISKILSQAKLHQKNIYTTKYKGKLYSIQIDNKKQLHSIAYFDELDNKVQIRFKNMRYGKKSLMPKEMECTYPITYDMIRG